MPFLRRQGVNLLLGFGAVAVLMALTAPDQHTTIFMASALAIVPLASHIGRATEELADRFGGGIGGLLNATFGNAAELIIGLLALRAGLPDLVKASITGSIIGNVLLVFGGAALIGGMGRPVQRFNRTAAGLGTTMLLLSAIGLAVPAVFHRVARNLADPPDLTLDTEIAVVLFVTYCISLVFMLKTHRSQYGSPAKAHEQPGRSVWAPMLVLLAAIGGVTVMSELLVREVTDVAQTLGLSQLFVGVVIVALVGNAAEHYSAVVFAASDRMDAAIAIAVGSSTQIALFVAPALVFLSYVVAPTPMDLLFSTFEVVAVAISVLSIAFIAHDGETHWMEGVMLLAIYAILGLAFYFVPTKSLAPL